jgi:hypothetical protein
MTTVDVALVEVKRACVQFAAAGNHQGRHDRAYEGTHVVTVT